MSTTTPSASSSARLSVASTTYVAPCSLRAGPNPSPRRLWAISMWSRTVTLNMSLSLAVRDRVAHGRQAPRGQPGHHLRQRVEVRLAREQRVEGRIAQQLERERHAGGRRAARRTCRRDDADLARADAQAARVE